ncbi:glycerol 3-phosphate permease [Capsaspora owczarzaki ATCC 30864]|uniref:Glycerol 3-phosphate permease n=1 Tax=Capsaspora owczarzaki (strain ATCC 30864) TaxID=595528 RepID=A0A0D2WSJ8_CAPO3|nr:glycerol 3-phosphate permease [Capsaspora owczarzaki ATCC 30864]KJE94443.1 glycerol 3-phosphate permease [Capsaspora owczarzaki ATCC 30864]|eukprot:XP_004346769.1 glycerol 3-phosphate permease [Capsaspora owczarzaki ATCC 30864]
MGLMNYLKQPGCPVGIQVARSMGCCARPAYEASDPLKAATKSDETPGWWQRVSEFCTVRVFYQFWALLLTFLCYTALHLARKPSSIVKDTLAPNNTSPSDPGWEPFVDNHSLLGNLDSVFLGAYAVGMFVSGHIADRMSLRLFLVIGMFGTALFMVFNGLAQTWNIHNFGYFVFVQIVMGLFQSTGWPAVVAVVGNWLGKGQRGLIMGLWNSNSSVGNIIGAVVCSAVLPWGWGWAFIVPGIICAAIGLFLFFFLVERPEDVGMLSVEQQRLFDAHRNGQLDDPRNVRAAEAVAAIFDSKLSTIHSKNGAISRNGSAKQLTSEDGVSDGLLSPPEPQLEPISFWRAWLIPGVAIYSASLFFCKLVSYTFMFWLPYYLSNTPVDGEKLDSSYSGYLSTLFDVGGIIGGVLIGLFSDMFDKPAILSTVFLYVAIPIMYVYRVYGPVNIATNVGLMILAGIAVQGPYSLITTAVSADLGGHESLKGNAQALATVTAIIDGTGSIGAALGPSIAGWIVDPNNAATWDYTFWMLMGMEAVSGILLSHLVYKEIQLIRKRRNGYTQVPEHAPPIIHRVASVY